MYTMDSGWKCYPEHRIRRHNPNKEPPPPFSKFPFQSVDTSVTLIPLLILICCQFPFCLALLPSPSRSHKPQEMDWLSRTLLGTPTIDSQPQQSNDAQDEVQSPYTASSLGTSPRGSPSDGESEAPSTRTSSRTTVSGPRHSERVARKRKSLPRLRTSGPSGMPEPRQAGSIILSPGANGVDPVAPPMAPGPADLDLLPSATEKATKDGVISTAPNVFGGQASEVCTFAEH